MLVCVSVSVCVSVCVWFLTFFLLSLSTSFLSSSRRRLLQQCSSSAGSESLDAFSISAPPSPRPASSQASSPRAADGKAWSPEPEPRPQPATKGLAALQSAPSPAALQDTSSQDTQSSGLEHTAVQTSSQRWAWCSLCVQLLCLC